jgi:hypothetical protein
VPALCHAIRDEQWSVVAEVGRPPVLGVGHHRRQIGLYGRQIEAVERLRIAEILAHRVRFLGMLAQQFELQLLRPPIAIRRAAAGGVAEGELGFGWHALARFVKRLSGL